MIGGPIEVNDITLSNPTNYREVQKQKEKDYDTVLKKHRTDK
jgi:hypothetical protein